MALRSARPRGPLQAAQERFRRNEANGRRYPSQMVRPGDELPVLDGHTHPDVARPGDSGRQLSKALSSLGQDLEDVLVSLSHGREDGLDEVLGHFVVEEVRHRVREDEPRSFPPQRQVESSGPKLEVEALLVGVPGYSPEALGKGLCIAVTQPGLTLEQPVTGFQVAWVHSIAEPSAIPRV
jgi:phage protein U